MSLVFSIAYNGYDRVWERCIASHGAYSARHGYDQLVIGLGVETNLSMEVAWLKIPLMIAALDAGQPWVMFIDSDAMFSGSAPRFETVAIDGKDVFLAPGHSGRPNSGVIILRNSRGARDFLIQVLKISGRWLPRAHRVGWGENGEVIHVASSHSAYAQIDRVWNNNSHVELVDYVRHFSAGPMRKTYSRTRSSEQQMKRTLEYRPTCKPGSSEFFKGLKSLLDPALEGPQFRLSQVRDLLEQMAHDAQL